MSFERGGVLKMPWGDVLPPRGSLGIVRNGEEFGYLVRRDDGLLVQVNGERVKILNQAKARWLIGEHAPTLPVVGDEAPAAVQPVAPVAPPPRPVVMVKKRRRIELPAIGEGAT